MPRTKATSKRRTIIMLYRNGKITKPEAMKMLKLERDYITFNALYHNCTQADFNEE